MHSISQTSLSVQKIIVNMTKESSNNPLLDVVDETGDLYDDLTDEFYDACAIDLPDKTDSNPPEASDDTDVFHDPEPHPDDVDTLRIREEEENLLSVEELEVIFNFFQIFRRNEKSKQLS